MMIEFKHRRKRPPLPTGCPEHPELHWLEPGREPAAAGNDLQAGARGLVRCPSRLRAIRPACDLLINGLAAKVSAGVRDTVRTVVAECLNNAIVHGNLEVDSSLRHAGDWDAYAQLIEAHENDPRYNQRLVELEFYQRGSLLQLAISDQGPGFDAQRKLQRMPLDSMLNNAGRGLMLIQHFSREMRFNAAGNQIELAIELAPTDSEQAA